MQLEEQIMKKRNRAKKKIEEIPALKCMSHDLSVEIAAYRPKELNGSAFLFFHSITMVF